MRGKPKVAKQVKEELDLLGRLIGWARWVLQAAAFFFIVSLGYLLYGAFSGVLRTADARITTNLTRMGHVLTLASFVGAACFCFLTIDELAYAVLIGLVGAGLMFGVPMMVQGNLRGANAQAGGAVLEAFHNAGMGVLIAVAVRILFEIIQQIRLAGEKRRLKAEIEVETGIKKVKKTPAGGGVWSPCWGLPYCHEAVREHCPAYKARRSCWRFGYGCNCDPTLIERLIRAGAMESGRGGQHLDSRTKATHEAFVRSDLQADRALKQRERTMPCTKCPIYLDHQRQKFKIVNPIFVVATLMAIAAAYKPLTVLYTVTVQAIARIASSFTYDKSRVDPGMWVSYLDTPVVKIFFFGIVAMLALAYVLKFVEWVIFEKKL
jgi:hypothetical protein